MKTPASNIPSLEPLVASSKPANVFFFLPSFDSQPIDRDVNTGGESSRPGGEVPRVDPPPASPATSSLSPTEGQGARQEQCGIKAIIFTSLPHVTDLTTYMIKGVIDFSKGLQEFR